MIKSSIKNIDIYKIKDDLINNVSFGFDQEWYDTRWKRGAGCGPTVASTLIYYINQNNYSVSDKYINNKNNCLKLMNEMWQYVTPSLQGVNTTKMFFDGVLEYAQSKGINLKHDFIDVPKKQVFRPRFENVVSFISGSLNNDRPVGFLNLSNGNEKLLQAWHWVTIIALEYLEDGSKAYATIMDEGVLKRIDLFLWFSTTTLGGGFVSFDRS